MPAFGLNRYSLSFIEAIFEKQKVIGGSGTEEDPFVYQDIGFRLSDRIQSAVDRLYGDLVGRFGSTTYPGLTRWVFVYPFVGALDWAHSLNMVADDGGGFGKYEISWSASGVTHTASGVILASLAATGNTHCDFGDVHAGSNNEAWFYHSFGFYNRSNAAVNEQAMIAYLGTNPSNGYTYFQRIIPRDGTGNAYFDLCTAQKTGQPTVADQVLVAVADSLGLFSASRISATDFRGYKRGVQVGATVVTNTGMGDGSGGAPMQFFGNRNIAFGFATRHGGGLSVAENGALSAFVQRFQVAMPRSV